MWTQEDKDSVIEQYTERNPTEETSLDIVKEIAEEWEKSPNAIRMILQRAGVYIKKDPTAKGATSEKKEGRVSKQDAIAMLNAKIAEAGVEVDESITEKMTGKAAMYFSSVLDTITGK